MVAVVALVFDKNIGFAAITAAVVLTALFPKQQKGAVSQIAWATVLLVAGVSTFATILETAGVPEYVGELGRRAGRGRARRADPLLRRRRGLRVRLVHRAAADHHPDRDPADHPAAGSSAVGLVAALAVSSTIVDVSPFSTNGALMLANRPDTITEEKYYKQILGYSRDRRGGRPAARLGRRRPAGLGAR